MANIGIVYTENYKGKDGKDAQAIIMDMRTLTERKKMTISVNINKYPDGKVNKNISPGKENYPDYHIWYNPSSRGEARPSTIIGNISNAVSQDGQTQYKKGKIFDPFLSPYNIYFSLFSVDEQKKIMPEHIYNIVAEPMRTQNSNSSNNSYGQQHAQPIYEYQTIPKDEDIQEEAQRAF